jgi:putative transposase
VELIWRSIKYEDVHLPAYASASEARTSLSRYINFYNAVRPQSILKAQTLGEEHFNRQSEPMAVYEQKQKLPFKEKAKTVRTTVPPSCLNLPTCKCSVGYLSYSKKGISVPLSVHRLGETAFP